MTNDDDSGAAGPYPQDLVRYPMTRPQLRHGFVTLLVEVEWSALVLLVLLSVLVSVGRGEVTAPAVAHEENTAVLHQKQHPRRPTAGANVFGAIALAVGVDDRSADQTDRRELHVEHGHHHSVQLGVLVRERKQLGMSRYAVAP